MTYCRACMTRRLKQTYPTEDLLDMCKDFLRLTTLTSLASAVCLVAPVAAQTASRPRPPVAPTAPAAPSPTRISPRSVAPKALAPLATLDGLDWPLLDGARGDALIASLDAAKNSLENLDLDFDVTAPLRTLNLDMAPMIASAMAPLTNFSVDFAPRASFSLPESPRASWASTDPADSLYRLARQSLNAGDYRKAAQLFAQITRQYPTSQYKSDAIYWRAFALYRIGDTSDLHEALTALDSVPPSRRSVNGVSTTTSSMMNEDPDVVSVSLTGAASKTAT